MTWIDEALQKERIQRKVRDSDMRHLTYMVQKLSSCRQCGYSLHYDCTKCSFIKNTLERQFGGIDEAIEAMNTYNTSSVSVIIEKYVVLSTSGYYKGSWVKEADAIAFCKKEVKSDTDKRFVILEAKKEIGTKTPEIEIEEL